MNSSRLRISLLAAIVAAPLVLLVWAQASGPRYAGLERGDRLPAADLLSASGEPVSTKSWRGTPTLLVLFQPGCKACRDEIAVLSQLAPAWPAVRIVLLSVKPGPVSRDAPFPVYVDPAGGFLRKTRKLLVPTLYWIDAEGFVVRDCVGRTGSGEHAAAFYDLSFPREHP